ncbi:MAG: hypothetical protein GY838_16850 [bacterium]|nr:hypothetical protein [bacterium]
MNETRHPAGHVLQAYHDGELPANEDAAVAAHCEDCPTCRTELEELAAMTGLLAASPTPELPRTVWHRVRPGRAKESRLRPAFGLAACAAGIILGFLVGPIRIAAEESSAESSWSESVTVWSGQASTSLLAVYQTGQE